MFDIFNDKDLRIPKRLSILFQNKLQEVKRTSKEYISLSKSQNSQFYGLELKFNMKGFIPLEISIYGKELNSFIGKTHIPHWEDFDVDTDKDYDIIERQLNDLLSNALEEREYPNGDVEIINLNTDEIFYSRKKIISIFGRCRIKDRYTYKSWID